MEIDPKVRLAVENFSVNKDRIFHKHSYFWIVYTYLVKSNHFLEIGYRKGLFTEVCRALNIPSVHIDISDKILRAKSDDKNCCLTIDSLSYLEKCTEKFDLIFQDGSKDFHVRQKEYDIINNSSILNSNGVILVDDLHYPDCQKSFEYAIKKYKFLHKTVKVKDKKSYNMGILTWTQDLN